jgi:hypothetical protein
MDKEKKARLEARGWKAGSAEEFLGLTPEEAPSSLSSPAVTSPSTQPAGTRNGLRLFPVRPDASPVTPELVKTLAADVD